MPTHIQQALPTHIHNTVHAAPPASRCATIYVVLPTHTYSRPCRHTHIAAQHLQLLLELRELSAVPLFLLLAAQHRHLRQYLYSCTSKASKQSSELRKQANRASKANKQSSEQAKRAQRVHRAHSSCTSKASKESSLRSHAAPLTLLRSNGIWLGYEALRY